MTEAEIQSRYSALSSRRRAHIDRVTDLMARLADRYGLDPDEAYWAGHGHDLAREMSRPALLAEAERYTIPVDDFEWDEPVLLHGPVAAVWLQAAGIGGPTVWEAIRFHTTAGPDLSLLAKALFIADGVEPGRNFPERAMLEALAFKNLDAAYYTLIRHTVDYLKSRRLAPHPRMLAALREDTETV